MIDETLKKVFGFSAFRPGQREAIETLMGSGRVLCILPTGHGKSLLYQLPAVLLGGVTVVISPLLALMRDQIKQLKERFGIAAGSINSDQSDEENAEARTLVAAGKLTILFVAPEQFDHVERMEFLLGLPIKLVVIDEAHCISTWGHDFRPSYRQILHFVRALGGVKVLALTATADAAVERDIQEQIESAVVLRESMNRPNIALSVIKLHGLPEKLAACEALVKQGGIIYTATRERAELVADYLTKEGLKVAAYHAGFESDKKRELQQAFLADEYQAIAATNALGMGIDKGNLRFVIHFDFPGSITAYYQEVGRAGRDGQKSEGILLYDPDDRKIQQYFIDSAQPKEEDFAAVLEATRGASLNLTAIKRLTGLHPTRVTNVLAELVEQNFLTKTAQNGVQVYLPAAQTGSCDLSRYKNQYQVKTRELRAMVNYAEERKRCRMAFLRKALGDSVTEPCGHCDVCLGQEVAVDLSRTAEIAKWLDERAHPIAPAKINAISEGVSLLDSTLASPLFATFMRGRQTVDFPDEALLQQLLKHLRGKNIACVSAIPSRTWKAREKVAEFLAKELNIPFLELFKWKELPEKRQGELLNNDQRHYNVQGKMTALPAPGALLLLDDYIGSGATLKEAARALRKEAKCLHPIIPCTLASVKWRLGQPGFT